MSDVGNESVAQETVGQQHSNTEPSFSQYLYTLGQLQPSLHEPSLKTNTLHFKVSPMGDTSKFLCMMTSQAQIYHTVTFQHNMKCISEMSINKNTIYNYNMICKVFLGAGL